MSQSLSFTESIKKVLIENYCNFNGRARRSEFWYWYLLTLIIDIICTILIQALPKLNTVFSIIFAVINLAILLPTIGVQVRRLHDTGRSGWFLLLILLPIIGLIILIIWFCQDSDASNEYGPSPKAASTDFMAV